ncbi:MAG: PEP-CTERM sorting domain-containing protein [Verrucomicrobiales bacterium]
MKTRSLLFVGFLGLLPAVSTARAVVIARQVDYYFHHLADPELQTMSLDLDGDAINDLTFLATEAFFIVAISAPVGNRITSDPPGNANSGARVAAVPPGALVGLQLLEPLTWWSAAEYNASLSGCGGLVEPICQGEFGPIYIGVEFDIAGGLHYGWVFLDSYFGGGHITQLAYESNPGEPILVPIPEPGTISLASLAAVALFRRRRPHRSSPWLSRAS